MSRRLLVSGYMRNRWNSTQILSLFGYLRSKNRRETAIKSTKQRCATIDLPWLQASKLTPPKHTQNVLTHTRYSRASPHCQHVPEWMHYRINIPRYTTCPRQPKHCPRPPRTGHKGLSCVLRNVWAVFNKRSLDSAKAGQGLPR